MSDTEREYLTTLRRDNRVRMEKLETELAAARAELGEHIRQWAEDSCETEASIEADAARAGIVRQGDSYGVEPIEDVVSRMADELAAARARLTWQPIETAPKDGTHLLLFRGLPQGACEAWWGQRAVLDFGWRWGGESWEYPSESQPTHWMPLPAPPGPDELLDIREKLRDTENEIARSSDAIARHPNSPSLLAGERSLEKRKHRLEADLAAARARIAALEAGLAEAADKCDRAVVAYLGVNSQRAGYFVTLTRGIAATLRALLAPRTGG